MASIDELKNRIDLHDLAEKLDLERPQANGNYKSPQHDDKSPSLSIFQNGKRWKDHSTDAGGTCIDLVMYVRDLPDSQDGIREAVKFLHEIYQIPFDRPQQQAVPREKSRAEYIAEKCMLQAERAIEYLAGRGIPEPVIKHAIDRGALGWNDWHSDKIEAGQHGYGGPGAAFIVRTLNPGHVVAVDMRYVDPALNGGTKTQCQGDKGFFWYSDLRAFKAARTVYVCESPINALSIESCGMRMTAAVACRGVSNLDVIADWPALRNKRVIVCMDNDEPDEKGKRPGSEAAWSIYERLTAFNISAMLVDQGDWQHNDVNDILQDSGPDELKHLLQRLEQWAIPGVRGDDKHKGRYRVFLPPHDFAQYWRYRAKEDFTTFIAERKQGDDGAEIDKFADLCGFRIASISRVTVASATSTMTGDVDSQPRVLFAVSVQAPRHGTTLIRRVFEDERLHNIEVWKKLGPVFNQSAFLRLISILERGADLGARHATNFVGLAWRDGRPIVNEGTDCYFTEPEKQCPYHSLQFPSGTKGDARRTIAAYQETFRKNAAAITLVWCLGGHLKAFLGFWPHFVMQANKGAGKSTLIKRLERSMAMTMFSRQTLSSEFRLLTSVSHTSHPVGWEEISAGKQEIIDKAVAMLQECYQYTLTRRGSEMTEYLLSAPVLLAGEDVPVRSLIGKLVQTDLTGKKGPIMPENLPPFPMRQWLEFLAGHSRAEVLATYEKAREFCLKHSRASGADDGAKRMAGNYAAIMTAWRLVCEFAEIDETQGDFKSDLLASMNGHISETSADREPWVWILELVLSEISKGAFGHPYTWGEVESHEGGERETCLITRTSWIMDHISHTPALRGRWDSLPVKSDRVFKRQLRNADMFVHDDLERVINKSREGHLVAIGVQRMAKYGLHASVPEQIDAFEP